jgi:pimeloyl-ACP methyl ester carboxylesterase
MSPQVADVTHRLVPSPAGRVHLAEPGTRPLVLLMHGFPESWYSWRRQLTALAAAHILDGCGHWTQQERPAEVNRLLTDWLASLSA